MSKWKEVERYTKIQRCKYKLEGVKNYNNSLSLKEKVHICNTLLPDIYEILIRKDEIIIFDKIGYNFYAEETETPIWLVVNYYDT